MIWYTKTFQISSRTPRMPFDILSRTTTNLFNKRLITLKLFFSIIALLCTTFLKFKDLKQFKGKHFLN